MNITYFKVGWAPNRFFDNDEKNAAPEEFFSATNNPLAEKLEVAYLERVDRYRQDFEKAYKQIRWGDFPWSGKYSALKVDFLGGPETIVFDEELDARLMEIYVLYGWDGILKLEAALKLAQEDKRTKSTEPWFVVAPFYLFTRNRLILLIRQALTEIEKNAAQDIITRLSQTSNLVATDYKNFDFKDKSSEMKGGAEGGSGSDRPASDHEIGNKGLANELYSILSKAKEFLALQEELLNRLKQLQQFESELKVKTMTTDVRQRYEAQERLNAYVQANKLKQSDIVQLLTRMSASFADIRDALFQKAPTALLALPLLKEKFTRPQMEETIYTVVDSFKTTVEKLGQGIDPQISRVQIDFQGIRQDQPISASELEGLYKFGYHLEAECVEKAIDNAVKAPAYLALLSEATLSRLIDNQIVQNGTLEHVTCVHYISTLIGKIEEKRASEEKWKGFFEALAKTGAGLSVAGLILTGTAVGGALTVASRITVVPTLIFQVYSVVHQLAQFDRALSLRVAEADAAGMGVLVDVGELSAMRAEYSQQITEIVLLEITLLRAAGRWGAVKTFLHLRGYYYDLEILLKASEGN